MLRGRKLLAESGIAIGSKSTGMAISQRLQILPSRRISMLFRTLQPLLLQKPGVHERQNGLGKGTRASAI